MPVTIQVAKHEASPVRDSAGDGRNNVKSSQKTLELLNHKSKEKDTIGLILQTAIGAQTSLPDAALKDMSFRIEDHGLIHAAYYAYSRHHHFVLRPEDIWFAILTQFSFYVNAHSEELRSSFVSHKGKKALVVRDPAQPDMGLMCRNMTKLIDQNITDPKLREWILPTFTTTTINDEVVASVIMMGTLQKYFEYVFDATCCGIPSITLLGEQSDWEDIQQRIEKLKEYGPQPSRFCDLLRPILKNMVASFHSNEPDVVDFWSRMVDRDCDSGKDDLTGWMTAFCFWDEEGNCLAKWQEGALTLDEYPPKKPLDLLGESYHKVNFDEIPAGYVTVPVTYIDPEGVVTPTKLQAGFVGFEEITQANLPRLGPRLKDTRPRPVGASRHGRGIRSLISRGKQRLGLSNGKVHSDPQIPEQAAHQSPTTEEEHGGATELNTLKPLTGWWMYKVKDDGGQAVGRESFYADLLGRCEGGASTGYVTQDGHTVVFKEGLPVD